MNVVATDKLHQDWEQLRDKLNDHDAWSTGWHGVVRRIGFIEDRVGVAMAQKWQKQRLDRLNPNWRGNGITP
jgi:hypothetical protein